MGLETILEQDVTSCQAPLFDATAKFALMFRERFVSFGLLDLDSSRTTVRLMLDRSLLLEENAVSAHSAGVHEVQDTLRTRGVERVTSNVPGHRTSIVD